MNEGHPAHARRPPPYTKDGIKFFEWQDVSKYRTMSSAEVTAEG